MRYETIMTDKARNGAAGTISWRPFILTLVLILSDQVTKALIVARIPEGTIAWAAGGDFFWLVHARNLGVAFSIGSELGVAFRRVLFILIPSALIAGALVMYWRGKGISALQRWALAILVAGGGGNLIDRIFRPDGVIDFLSFKFYGLFGLERWPTFNVADMCVFCSAILLGVTGFLMGEVEADKDGSR